MAKRIDRDSAQLLAHDRNVRGKKDQLSHRLNQACQPCVTRIVELIGRLPAQHCPYCRRRIWSKTQRK
jgi:DNA-directed RNA polymerase subunit RPC12/RpoP